MDGSAQNGFWSGMHEHLVNFLDNFSLCGKPAAGFVTIKMTRSAEADLVCSEVLRYDGGKFRQIGRTA